MPYPKIELHVHLEGTVRPATLLEIAGRNGVALPADTVEGLAELYRFRDFAHFIEVWVMTTAALQTAADYRQIVVDYAAEAAAHGAVYIEGIFSPARPAADGTSWEEIFEGYCDGAQEARELQSFRRSPTPRPSTSAATAGSPRSPTPARSPGSTRSAAPAAPSGRIASATGSAPSKTRRCSAPLCDAETKDALRRLGAAYEWPAG